MRRRGAAARVHATPQRRVEAVAIGSAAETEQEEVAPLVDPYAEDASEELPVTPWASTVAR